MQSTTDDADRRSDDSRAPARTPQTWVFLGARGSAIAPVVDEVTQLARADHTVRFGYAAGRPPRTLPDHVARHRIGVGWRRQREVRQAVTNADHVVYLDPGATPLRAKVTELAPQARQWQPDEVLDVLAEERHWRHLDHWLHALAAREDHQQLPVKWIRWAVEWLSGHPVRRLRPPADPRPAAVTLAFRLVRRGKLADVRTVLAAAALVDEYLPEPEDQASRRAIHSHLALTLDDAPPEDLAAQLTGVFAEADRALAGQDPDRAAHRAALGLDLMFHPRLHTDVPRTPLVDVPQHYLAPFYGSAVGRLLTTPAPQRPVAPPVDQPTGRDHTLVTVLPGSYPWHADRLIRSLEEDHRFDVARLVFADRSMRGMGLTGSFVRYRLARSSDPRADGPPPIQPVESDVLGRSDVVFADWADKGAVWASLTLPPGARLVVRMHSVDVLSAAVHLVDWSRVDDAVFVAPHIERLFRDLLGDRVAGVRSHVIPNIIPPQPVGTARVAERHRTLVMVGWGKRVKDPMLALDVLSELRRSDPQWRLRLIGGDFPPSQSKGVNDYATAFRRRVLEPELLDAVEFVGHTSDVPGQLADAGFVLSTSLREALHTGVLEALAAGALPVVRNWPAFARLHGAASLFPERCVFDTAAQAVAMVLAHADEGARSAAVAEVQRELATVLDGSAVAPRLLRVIAG